MSQYALLIGQVSQDLAELGHLVAQTIKLAQKAQQTGDNDYLGTVALNMHGFYTGAERIFEEIAKQIDGSVPSGSDWHSRLLRQMSAELPEVRPPAISQKTRNALDEYRAFRHVVRNVYTFELRPARIKELVSDLPACYDLLVIDTQAFFDFLLAASPEPSIEGSEPNSPG